MRKLLLILSVVFCGFAGVSAHAQACGLQGQFTAQGNFVCPGNPTPAPSFNSILFGMHVHSPTATLPSVPFDALRLEGTSCLWNTIVTAGPTYNFSCLAQWIGYGNQFNVDLIFTLGQVPTFLSTISTDPGPFPVATNGVSIACQSGSCTATVTTLQRMNGTVGDSMTLSGADGSCPETVNLTANASAVTNTTDYPGWTYIFPIGSGSTNSSGCGGAAMTLTDNTQVTAGASRCGGTPAGPIQKGGCYSPGDVNIDGTGNDCQFSQAGGPCSGGFLSNLLTWLASNDPNHRFKYLEMWNEPQGAGFFNGSIAQMARMQKDAFTTIQASSRADIILTSPAPSGGPVSVQSYFQLYCADPSKPMQYAQQIDFHSYNYPATGTPDPGAVSTIAQNVKNVMASCPLVGQTKPLWVSEGSWGQGSFAASATNINFGTPTSSIPNKPGWIFQWHLQHETAGLARAYWYAWDQQCNTGMSCSGPNTIQPAGIAYGIAHDVLSGATLTQLATKDSSNNWTMKLSRPGGYIALIVWNNNLTVPAAFTIPANVYKDCRDDAGNIQQVAVGQTSVLISYDPLTCESGPPPTALTNLTIPSGGVGVVYSGSMTALCANPACTYSERSLPSVLGANGLSLNSANGAISGTPIASGTSTVQIGIEDASRQSYALNYTLNITGALPLAILSCAPGNGMVGIPYMSTCSATGGLPPYTWTVSAGTIPHNTSLNTVANQGIISGTPDTATTYTPTLTVTDSSLPMHQTAVAGPFSIVIAPSAGGCGKPNFLCSTTSTVVAQYPTPPFNASTHINSIGYDTSLNPGGSGVSGTDPIVQISDSTTCGGNGISVVGISGGDENGTFNSNDTLIAINCTGGTIKFVGFNPVTMQVTGATSVGLINISGGTTFAKTNPNIFYSQSQGNGTTIFPKIYKTTFTSTNPPTFTQAVFIDPAIVCSPFIPATGVTGGTVTISLDDNILHAALLTAGQNSPGYIYDYNIATGQCAALSLLTTTNNVRRWDGTITTAAGQNLCLPIALHNSTIFGNGTFSRFTTGPIGSCTNEPYYWQIGTALVFGCGAGTGTGHNHNGYNLEVESNNPHLMWGDATLAPATYCANIASQSYGTYPFAGISGDLETHFSVGWDTLDSNPIIAGTGYFTWDGTNWGFSGVNEILAYKRPFTVPIRFGHNFISGGVLCPLPTCNFRTQNGIGSVSESEKFFEYSSDERMGLGANCTEQGVPGLVQCQYVFVVRLD